MSYDQRYVDLLREVASSPVRRFLLLEGFAGHPEDSCRNPDAEGDVLMLRVTYELRCSTGPVHILVHENARPEDVRRLLRKALEDLEDDAPGGSAFDVLAAAEEEELLARAGIYPEGLMPGAPTRWPEDE